MGGGQVHRRPACALEALEARSPCSRRPPPSAAPLTARSRAQVSRPAAALGGGKKFGGEKFGKGGGKGGFSKGGGVSSFGGGKR